MSKPKKPVTGVIAGLIRNFHSEIAEEKRAILGSVMMVAGTVMFRVLEPWPLKFIYDAIFIQSKVHSKRHPVHIPRFLSFATSGHHIQTLLALSVLSIIAINAAGGTLNYMSSVSMAVAFSRILTNVRARLFCHLANLSLSFHNRHKVGDMIAHITSDIDRLRNVTVAAALPLFTTSATLVVMLVIMFRMNWRLGSLALLAFPIFFLTVHRITPRIQNAARLQRMRDAAITATTAEAIGCISTIQAFSLQKVFLDLFSIENRGSLGEGVKTQKLSANLERMVDLIAATTTAAVLWFGAHSVMDNTLTPGDLIVFVSYLRNSFKPIRRTARYVAQIAKASASGRRILLLMDEIPEIQDSPDAMAAPTFKGHVVFEHVSFSYGNKIPVLHDINFEIKPGQKVALVGPSGSGKSTITSLLLRFHDPDQGRILVDGKDIRNYTLESLRGQISLVMQESLLFAVSVHENIAYGAVGAHRGDVVEAARIANAHNFIEQMPLQYDTVIGERGSTLSGGQKQRIAIARAVIRQAPLLVLDEPTTGLDTQNEEEVSLALDRLSESRTSLLITHNLKSAAQANVILFLSEGKIEECGTHLQLMSEGGKYAKMFKSQAAWETTLQTMYAVSE